VNQGFSLLEVVVVLVISAILAAIAIPFFRPAEVDARWFADQVRAAISYAQRQAVAQKSLVYVRVTGTTLELCYAPPTPAACPSPLTGIIDGAPYKLDAPSGVTLSPAGFFFFNGLGQPSSGTVVNVNGHAVTVNAETGYVQSAP